MSVATYKRKMSSATFVEIALSIEEVLSEFVTRLPVKYRQNMGDNLIQLGTELFHYCVYANSIKVEDEETYKERRKTLKYAITITNEFLADYNTLVKTMRKIDGIVKDAKKAKKLNKLSEKDISNYEQRIGTLAGQCCKLIDGVMKSDRDRAKKNGYI